MDPGTAESHRDEKCKCISQCGSGKWKDAVLVARILSMITDLEASGFD